ncbi:Autoinducer 2 sensor kinase/phosphatase LuxQ [Posidoniimonas polymericola]|uniref:histidine kinase n=1 Tax=Posidoniimonas polymericola TaxID=2528002 RepID=A0A5C5ZES4_9BACT|nr:ATP-binding protein [Posidoniimonas polymericola]TWT85822.1 Autoinducer 2 sensor kinase/phosphatase LuxQ [Posidoniimonas polymericola]
MSYESFKRVLGESNLERKCLLWFGVSLSVMLFLIFYYFSVWVKGQYAENDRKLGPELVRAAWLEEHFNIVEKMVAEPRADRSQQTGPFAADDEAAAAAPESLEVGLYLQALESSKTVGSRFDWYAILPEPSSRNLAEERDYIYYYPGRYDYERELLQDIFANPTAPKEDDSSSDGRAAEDRPKNFQERVVNLDGRMRYRYYQPLYADKSCVDCHRALGGAPRPYVEGDLLGVICVEVDREQAEGNLASLRASMWTAAVLIAFISMFLLYFIIRYVIVKPVQHLRDVANAVREGDIEQRAEILTGDEFEELAASFNRMLRRLLRQQDALQEVNEELDAKIDQIAQANMRLFEMNRLKSDFLATMSHELRTPLNSILGFSDVLAGVEGLSDKQQRYVSNIQRSGRMLLEMINDILDLAKMESGKMDIRPTDFRIDAVVSAQCDMARPLTERKNIDLDCDFAPDLPMMRQDQGKLQQILNNLLSNAIKFTPEGGRIVVRTARHDDQYARLTVEDTGVGISEADQTIVFEKFRQGGSAQPQGNAMTREHSGTGLGLSIVRELCRLLGGEVSLSSVLGKGSTFTVLLPWEVSVNQNMEAHLQQEVAELTRTTLASD